MLAISLPQRTLLSARRSGRALLSASLAQQASFCVSVPALSGQLASFFLSVRHFWAQDASFLLRALLARPTLFSVSTSRLWPALLVRPVYLSSSSHSSRAFSVVTLRPISVEQTSCHGVSCAFASRSLRAQVTRRPSSALRSQPSARRSLSRRRRNAAQLPSSRDRHSILRDAAIQECAQHRERAVAEADLLVNQARSMRSSSSSQQCELRTCGEHQIGNNKTVRLRRTGRGGGNLANSTLNVRNR
jgi:hypothetical protein